MAAKGTIAKEAITKKILSTFDGSFVNGKEIRIPFMEEGNLIQIKITLTAAKENIAGNVAEILPGETHAEVATLPTAASSASTLVEPTEEEINNLKQLMNAVF